MYTGYRIFLNNCAIVMQNRFAAIAKINMINFKPLK